MSVVSESLEHGISLCNAEVTKGGIVFFVVVVGQCRGTRDWYLHIHTYDNKVR